MAHVQNPRKAFQFNIYIAGIDPFCCQDVKLPDNAIDSVEHGDTNYKVKTGGMVEITDLNIKKILSSSALDRYVWDLQRRIQNTNTGGGELPSDYKFTIRVEQLAPNGITVLQTWLYEGCWPKKINGVDFSRMKSENTIEDIDFSVDRLIP